MKDRIIQAINNRINIRDSISDKFLKTINQINNEYFEKIDFEGEIDKINTQIKLNDKEIEKLNDKIKEINCNNWVLDQKIDYLKEMQIKYKGE